jgi:hydroxymethylpyrimidine pyrophosphatase-like HAD family hydrolase
LCIIAANNGDMDAIHAELERYCADEPLLTVVRNDVYARFSHAAYNKGTALAEITRRLGMEPAQVFAAGDHFNDLPMLSLHHARALAAPANAVPAVQAKVREQGGYVSAMPQGNGVWDALDHFLKRNDRTLV